MGTATFIGLPCRWVDDEVTTLPVIDENEGGSINDMYIDGETVYTGGFVQENSQALAAYWQDDQLTYYQCPGNECIGKAIAVDNGDVYLATGITYTGPLYKAVYYKNGELVELTALSDDDENAWPMDIAVKDGNVLVVGYYYAADATYKPVVWVNGEMQQLSMLDSDLEGEADAIQIYKGHVYISGSTTRVKDSEATPPVLATIVCYWVDGERVDLPGLTEDSETNPEGNGLAIFVSKE